MLEKMLADPLDAHICRSIYQLPDAPPPPKLPPPPLNPPLSLEPLLLLQSLLLLEPPILPAMREKPDLTCSTAACAMSGAKWCPEFTSLCPKTGLPDFGEIRITYVPDAQCIELKALKYYLIGFRDRGIFYEHATNQILDDLVKATQSQWMRIEGDFLIRGGIRTLVVAEHGKKH